MKTILNKLVPLQLAALFLFLLTPALASPAHPAVPFRGSIQGVEIATVDFPWLYVDASGSGTASQLGSFTLTYELTVDIQTLPFEVETFGTAVFTAANGDKLFTDIEGLGTPNPDNTVSVVEVHTITGGTGRFEEASGTFIRTYQLDQITGVTSGSFAGTLRLN